jgi:ABC-2 type transport system permease protein
MGSRTRLALSAFLATFHRDLVVTGREFIPFLMQALMQPLFFLFIFGKVLPGIGLAAPNFAALMLPGIVALTGMIAAMQGVTLPLVLDLGFAREIDDRLLAPMPVWFVALEKVLFGAVRGAVASSVIFPLGWVILGSGFAVRTDRMFTLVAMVLLTGLVGSTVGLLMGTIIKPDQISLMFTLIFTPLLFTGCTYYPWGALSRIRWFQILTLLNPLTYAAEGLRYAMVPAMGGRDFPTLPLYWILVALPASVIVVFLMGKRTFCKRVVS